MMAAPRTASRSLLGTRRKTMQYSWASFSTPQAAQSRSISYATRSNAFSNTRSTSNLLRATPKHLQNFQLLNSLPSRRAFSATRVAGHGDWHPPKAGEELYVTFVDKEGDEHKIAVSKGDNLLDVAQANDIEMEGACGGSCACSTCHVIVEDEEMYDKIPEPDDDENDMLDLAFGLTETSRLGCQIIMNEELNGIRVRLPSMTRNMQASDFGQK